jgi:site-specific recombinase XerC
MKPKKKPTTPKPTTTTTSRATTTTPKRTAGRAIEPADRKRILETLELWTADRSFLALRTRAFVLLCWGSGLRVREATALNVSQVLAGIPSRRACTVRDTAYQRGSFAISKAARSALREYLLAGFARGWLRFPAGPLFVAMHGGEPKRLSVRSAQHCWAELQQRAQLAQHYRTDDLRFDALLRASLASKGNVHALKSFGRFRDVRTAAKYLSEPTTSLAELSAIVARS